MARHYLDHASTSPPRPEVVRAMTEVFDRTVGDPGRLHHEGLIARQLIEDARESVATFFGARPREVVFTSGATESIAAAVFGCRDRGSRMVVAPVEHSAVREQVARFSTPSEPRVDGTGRVATEDVVALLEGPVAAVHLQWGNHEVGTLQPVAEVAHECRSRDVLLHVDAAQAAGHVPIRFDELGVDLLSVSAHKFGGPAGVGALLIRRGLRLDPLLIGSEQERARRAGLENLPGIVGFGAACRALTDAALTAEADRQLRQTGRFVDWSDSVQGLEVLGDPVARLPHIACVAVEGVEPQAVLLGLDRAGVAAHSGSACASESLEPSPVLEAMGVDARRSLRISTGWNTTDDDIDALVEALPPILAELRALGS